MNTYVYVEAHGHPAARPGKTTEQHLDPPSPRALGESPVNLMGWQMVRRTHCTPEFLELSLKCYYFPLKFHDGISILHPILSPIQHPIPHHTPLILSDRTYPLPFPLSNP